jgi:predicted Zn-dependent protease
MLAETLPLDWPTTETDLVAIADAATQKQETPDALAAWAVVREKFPANHLAWLRPGELLINQHQLEEADRLLDDGMRRFPAEFWLARWRAKVPDLQGDPAESLARTRALRYAFAGRPVARSDFAGCLLEMGNIRAAEAEAADGLTLFPNFDWLLSIYARCAEASGDNAAAADRWTNLLAYHPAHQAAFAPAVRALAAVGRTQEAVGIAVAGLTLFPNHKALCDALAAIRSSGESGSETAADDESLNERAADLLAAQAQRAEQGEDWHKAERLWFRYRRGMPGRSMGYACGARALLRLGRATEAEIVLAHAGRAWPADPQINTAWAEAALQRQDLDEALRRFQAMQKSFPQDPAGPTGIATVLLRLGRFTEAEQLLHPVIAVSSPANRAAMVCYAQAASARGDWVEAAHRWSDVWAAFPHQAEYHRFLAEALRNADNPTDADSILTDATARFPDDFTTAEQWAETANADCDGPRAIERWTELTRRFPDRASVWLVLAERLQAVGRNPEAESVLGDAILRFPEHPDLRRRHAAAASRRGDFTTAARRNRGGGWTQPPAAPNPVPNPVQGAAPAWIALALATSRDEFLQTRALLRSLLAHCEKGSCPDLLISVTNEQECDDLKSMLAEEPGLAATIKWIIQRNAAPTALREAIPDVPRLGISLSEARARHARNYQRLHLVSAAVARGCDLVAVLDNRSRMFRGANLTAALRDLAARREFRYRRSASMDSAEAAGHAASVRSAWPSVAPGHMLLRADGRRDNIRLYHRDAFFSFADHLTRLGSIYWHERTPDALRNEHAWRLASRLLPGGDDWAAFQAWSVGASASPYRLTALDDIADLFDVPADADLWTQARASGFDRRFLQAVTPPFVPPTADATLLAMIADCLSPTTCLMCPDDGAVLSGSPGA